MAPIAPDVTALQSDAGAAFLRFVLAGLWIAH